MEKKTMGKFIAALRKANGLTQQDVADKLHVSNKAVSRWERDECAPDLSLIPAIAEMFDVTADELLKGERITKEAGLCKTEPKVEKQLKAIINRALSRFRSTIYVSLSLAFVGLICMFGISYGFYRPVIGFAAIMIFELAAVVTALIALNKLKEVKTDNELFESADPALTDKYTETMSGYSFTAFFAAFSAAALALPIIFSLPGGDTMSVITFDYYLTELFPLVLLPLIMLFFFLKSPCCALIAGNRPRFHVDKALLKLDLVQFGFTAAAVLDIMLNLVWSFDAAAGVLFILFCLVVVGAVPFFALRDKPNRKQIILSGIRNVLLAADSLFILTGLSIGFGPADEMWVTFDFAEIFPGLIAAAGIIMIFSLINRKSNKKA